MVVVRALLLCLLAVAASGASGARVELALRVPFEVLREALAAQLAASPAGPNVVYREGACRYLRVEAPEVEGRDGNLRLTAPGSAALGLEMPGGCAGAATWRGSMALTVAPQLDAAGRLRLRIIDSRLVDGPGGAPLALVWELAKPQAHARLEAFALDIGPLRAALVQLVQSTAPPREAAALGQVLAGLELRAPRVEAAGVLVPLVLEVPDAWVAAPPPAPAAAPLTEAELEALDLALQPWDAFLAYVIKQIALENADPALRQRLFTLLLDSRYRLSRVLSGEEATPGDPLRALFIDAWDELRAMPELARHVAFVDAGEALLALDRALPGLGAQLSADGLRQMARRLRPADTADPVAFDWAVDGELRTLFDVEEIPAAPPAAPRRSVLDLFIASAHAREMRALDTWVPRRNELEDYQGRIDALLRETSAAELPRGALDAPYDAVYRHLVPATALIESCWRQYVVRGGKVRYLRSSASSVGIMQINERVWRGFYDVKRLRWDTAYNARAGARILLRYLKDYAVPYAQRSGNPDDAPRAAYAVYNAGPRAVGRFAKKPPHPREKRVDDRLWTLYQGVASGGQADLRSCGVASTTAAQ